MSLGVPRFLPRWVISCFTALFVVLALQLAYPVQAQWSSNGSNIYFNTGYVGIGTPSPGQKLTLDQGNFNLTNGYQVEWGTTAKSFLYGSQGGSGYLIFSTNGTDRMRIDALGNVGIGTTTPEAKLSIRKVLAANNTIENLLTIDSEFGSATASGFGGGILFRGRNTSNVNTAQAQISSVLEAGGDRFGLSLYTTPSAGALTERVRIAHDGRVGIGTTTPNGAYQLTVKGDGSSYPVGGAAFHSGGNSGAFLGYPTNTDAVNFELWNSNNGYLRFGTSNAERLRILSSGNVGIGTPSPTTSLEVKGSGSAGSLPLVRINSTVTGKSGLGLQTNDATVGGFTLSLL